MATGLSVHLQGKSAICIRPDTDGSEDLKRRPPRTTDRHAVFSLRFNRQSSWIEKGTK